MNIGFHTVASTDSNLNSPTDSVVNTPYTKAKIAEWSSTYINSLETDELVFAASMSNVYPRKPFPTLRVPIFASSWM